MPVQEFACSRDTNTILFREKQTLKPRKVVIVALLTVQEAFCVYASTIVKALCDQRLSSYIYCSLGCLQCVFI